MNDPSIRGRILAHGVSLAQSVKQRFPRQGDAISQQVPGQSDRISGTVVYPTACSAANAGPSAIVGHHSPLPRPDQDAHIEVANRMSKRKRNRTENSYVYDNIKVAPDEARPIKAAFPSKQCKVEGCIRQSKKSTDGSCRFCKSHMREAGLEPVRR